MHAHMAPVAPAPASAAPAPYRIDDLVVDAQAGRVLRGADEIELPRLSYELPLALPRAAPAHLSVDALMTQVWPGPVVPPETVSQRSNPMTGATGADAQPPRPPTRVVG